MGDFKIISFTELICGDAACHQNSGALHESSVPSNCVYIQDVYGKLWKTEDWDKSVKPNAIVVFAKEAKFRIALNKQLSMDSISSKCTDPLENYVTAIKDEDAAMVDYDGACNTAKILQLKPSTGYAAGYCNSFTFPDGKTKGYLPSLGQLYLAYQNKVAINAALAVCGGTVMAESWYWSSTFRGLLVDVRRCWGLDWSDGRISSSGLDYDKYVRPFADL